MCWLAGWLAGGTDEARNHSDLSSSLAQWKLSEQRNDMCDKALKWERPTWVSKPCPYQRKHSENYAESIKFLTASTQNLSIYFTDAPQKKSEGQDIRYEGSRTLSR